MDKGWGVAAVKEIPPVEADWPARWKSIRHHFGITAFGINGCSKDAGEVMVPEHDETASGQQEVFFVHEGEALVTIDGEEMTVPAGSIVAVEPHVKRQLVANASPTTIILVGGPPGKAYQVGEWEK